MKFVEVFDRILSSVEKTLVVFILFSMVALTCLQIVLRNIFAAGILSSDIVLRHMTLGLAFLGASMATKEGKHLRIDVFPQMLSSRWRDLISLITHALSIFVCLILSRAGWNFVALEQQSETVFAFNIPLWAAKLIIPCGFLLIAFRFVLKMINRSHALVFRKSVVDTSEDGDAG